MALTVEHDGITITYEEQSDRWTFELRGRSRSCESLAKAKETIERPVKEGTKKFERIQAYKMSYGDRPKLVAVTSIAERTRYGGGGYVWISDGGQREKVNASRLRAVSPANDAIVANITALRSEADALHEKASELEKGLTALELPPDEE